MRISHNELLSLLKRVFEGIYGRDRDFDAMARRVLWLETHGLNGVEELRQAIPSLQASVQIPLSVTINQDEGVLTADLSGNCLFQYSIELVDIFIDISNRAGACRLEITNFTNPIALVTGLPRCARGQCAAQLEWYDQETNTIHIVELTVDTSVPEYTIFDAPEQSEKYNRGSYVCMSFNGVKNTLQNPIKSKSAQELFETYQSSLDDGIEISKRDYDELSKVAESILVEASEASRRGAGD